MRDFRVNNVIKAGARCGCQSRVSVAIDSDEYALPPSMHDALVEQGRMTPAMRDYMRDDKQRADERMTRAITMQANPYPRASPAPEYADMMPPSLGDAIKKARRK